MKTKRNVSKLFTILLSLVMLVGLMPTTAFATDATVIKVNDGTEFSNAIATVNDATTGDFVISLTGDIQISSVVINSPCPVTILGNGHTITVAKNECINISTGSQLYLGSTDGNALNIKGVAESNNDVPGILYIQGTCNMYSGVTLSQRESSNYFGGGVTVQGGTFHMYGGTIENCGINGGSVCYGGGVAVVYGGTFVMDSGEIKNCYVKSNYTDSYDPNRCLTAMGGGVFVSGGSSFIMNGGTISDNEATNMGGGVAVVASYEEISSGFGNLKSSAETYAGTIKSNSAKSGAGVFASAYYYAYAGGLCASIPSVSQSGKQGLYIKNAEITDNRSDETKGLGGGLLVAMLKSPAIATITDTTIKNNTAYIGSGIMSYGYWTTMTIDESTITGNIAKGEGGGFAADSNTSGGKTTITNTILCNNISETGGSDVYLNKAPLELSSALDMNAIYLGQPEDVTNKKIDGWYVDTVDSRYISQSKEMRTEYTSFANIPAEGRVYLIAAAYPSFAKVTFTNEDGTIIFGENWYPIGTSSENIDIPNATKASDDMYDYIFESWSPEIEDVTGDKIYTANFKKVFKKFHAIYEYRSKIPSKVLPDEIMTLLPVDMNSYYQNDTISAINPVQTVIDVTDGKWTFRGFDKEFVTANMVNADENGYVKFVGYWEYEEKKPTTYTVSFNINGHGTQVAAQTVEQGKMAEKPADPTAEGYTFKGWYADEQFSTAFDFENTAIKQDTIIYAKWEKNAEKPTEPSKPSEPTNPTKPSEPTKPAETNPNTGVEVPKTGDNSNMALWIALLFVSAAGVFGATVYGKKKKSMR